MVYYKCTPLVSVYLHVIMGTNHQFTIHLKEAVCMGWTLRCGVQKGPNLKSSDAAHFDGVIVMVQILGSGKWQDSESMY